MVRRANLDRPATRLFVRQYVRPPERIANAHNTKSVVQNVQEEMTIIESIIKMGQMSKRILLYTLKSWPLLIYQTPLTIRNGCMCFVIKRVVQFRTQSIKHLLDAFIQKKRFCTYTVIWSMTLFSINLIPINTQSLNAYPETKSRTFIALLL